MELVVRAAALLLAAYFTYYAFRGTGAEVQGAAQIIYYVLRLADVLLTQHGLW